MENQFGLKLEFYSTDDNTVSSEYVIEKQFEGFPGIAHGGIIASILDELCVRPFMVSDPNRFTYTAKLTTRYRAPVPINKRLKLVGKITKDRGRMGEAEAFIYDENGKILAQANAMVVEYKDIDENQLVEDNLGWKVYPDKEI
jgi:acyl-coenzyme A thioesterase PaaI-like protein